MILQGFATVRVSAIIPEVSATASRWSVAPLVGTVTAAVQVTSTAALVSWLIAMVLRLMVLERAGATVVAAVAGPCHQRRGRFEWTKWVV